MGETKLLINYRNSNHLYHICKVQPYYSDMFNNYRNINRTNSNTRYIIMRLIIIF